MNIEHKQFKLDKSRKCAIRLLLNDLFFPQFISHLFRFSVVVYATMIRFELPRNVIGWSDWIKAIEKKLIKIILMAEMSPKFGIRKKKRWIQIANWNGFKLPTKYFHKWD